MDLIEELKKSRAMKTVTKEMQIDAGLAFLQDSGLADYAEELIRVIDFCDSVEDLALLFSGNSSYSRNTRFDETDRFKLDALYRRIENQDAGDTDVTGKNNQKELPEWLPDQGAFGKLTYGNVVVKEFKRKGTNQIRLIEAFSQNGWAQKIPNPFLDVANHESACECLRTTADDLTRRLTSNVIRFGTVDARQSATWIRH